VTRTLVRLVAGPETCQAVERPPCLSGKEPVLLLRAFWQDEQGQGMVEYALVIIVIAIAIIFMLVIMRDQIGNFFSNVGNNLT
jgi:pilus assembly protein Flp/PilA